MSPQLHSLRGILESLKSWIGQSRRPVSALSLSVLWRLRLRVGERLTLVDRLKLRLIRVGVAAFGRGIWPITAEDNLRSIGLLAKLEFRFLKYSVNPDKETVEVYNL